MHTRVPHTPPLQLPTQHTANTTAYQLAVVNQVSQVQLQQSLSGDYRGDYSKCSCHTLLSGKLFPLRVTHSFSADTAVREGEDTTLNPAAVHHTKQDKCNLQTSNVLLCGIYAFPGCKQHSSAHTHHHTNMARMASAMCMCACVCMCMHPHMHTHTPPSPHTDIRTQGYDG